MNIIKPANKEKLDRIKGVKLFVCPHCDCEFEANDKEYQRGHRTFEGKIYCDCPECGTRIYREHINGVR